MNSFLYLSTRLLPSCLLGLQAGGFHTAAAGPSESGLVRIAEYPPHVCKGHSQAFQSVQGADGVVCFTHYGAVLTWDGERWGRIPVPGAGFLYGIVALNDNRFAVCGVNTVAVIEPDGAGAFTSRFLAGELPDVVRNDWQQSAEQSCNNLPGGDFISAREPSS